MKIQALAVAAASLAIAAPALPAQANTRLDRALYEVATVHCGVLANGGSWTEAVRATMRGTDYANHWRPGAKRHSSALYDKLLALKVHSVNQMCPALNRRAFREYELTQGRTPSAPTYTGGNTNISDDPFEF